LYILTVSRGPDQGKKIELSEGQSCTIGSDPGSSLALSDPKVLEHHCSLEVREGQILLVNHTASAGTFVGEKRVNRARIQPTVTFRVGDTHLTLEIKVRRRNTDPNDPMLGKILGGYKVIEVVGRGGMGTVYKATQLSLHRDVALKVLRPRLARDEAFVELFINEARSAAQLVHPNVVQVFDAGKEGDSPYFSMEFMGHGSVEEKLEREGKIPWEEAILMILEAAHGLEFAEGKEVVHRDIKPDNLMLNEDGQVKIADLGLAKRGASAKEEGITGTPHFIPPEQALGKEVDTRADIYSLGATFFRMITDKTLFTGKTAKEIVLKHIKEAPPAASSAEPSIPDELDLVIAKMLAKDPGQRYQTVRELISALEEVCAQFGIKGSIIRRGVGKRVMIPVVALLLAAVAVVIFLLSQDPERIIEVDEKSKEAARRSEAARKLEETRKKEALLRERETNAKSDLLQLNNADLALQARVRLSAVFVNLLLAESRKGEWLALARRYEEFGKSKDARDFGLAEEAQKRAETIRKDLKRYEASADDQRKQIAVMVERATKIAREMNLLVKEAQSERRFEDAWNRCQILAAKKTAPGDPFHEIVTWVWKSPVDETLTPMGAMESEEIADVVNKAREQFESEGRLIPTLAERNWKTVQRTIAPALKEEATEEQLELALGHLDEVTTRFPSSGRHQREIRDCVKEAARIQKTLQARLDRIRTTRLADDRALIRSKLRRMRSLDPDVIPNTVMVLAISPAIDEWSKLIQENGQVQTQTYRRFVSERIQMLRWIDYLFARFHDDLKAHLIAKGDGPLLNVDIELPDPESREGEVATKLTGPESGDIYRIWFAKKIQGQKEVKLGTLPMDWVFHRILCREGKPRWKEVPPVLEFALGCYCFETMQPREAIVHFGALVDHPRYGQAARNLLVRAKQEWAALEEYQDILRQWRELGKQGTSAAVGELIKRLQSFHLRHEGTLFYLDVMPRNTKMRKDFFDHKNVPDIPKAPPRPE
jgi:serine/threonine protein kinase